MKKYLIYITLFITNACVVTYGIFRTYKSGYKEYYKYEYESLEEKINGRQPYDIVFLGSSRTLYEVNPKTADSVFNLTTFNAGIAGANTLETKIIFDCYLRSRPKPKLFVIDLSAAAFSIDMRPIYNPNIYLPFLNNPVVYEALKPYKRVFVLKHLPFIQLTESDDITRQHAIFGLTGKNKYSETDFFRGHQKSGSDSIKLPFKLTWPNTSNLPIDEKGIQYFRDMIRKCKALDIGIAAVYPPDYKEFRISLLPPTLLPTIARVCKEENIPFLNLRRHYLSQNHQMFKDEVHLNDKGTEIYTRLLAKKLIELFPNILSTGDSLLRDNDNSTKQVTQPAASVY